MKKITKEWIEQLLPIRADDVYKGSFGRILCVGGNETMGGAIIMSSAAALHAGAGLVTVATAQVNRSALHARSPECMFVDMFDCEALTTAIHQSDVILLGPGLGRDEPAQLIFETTLQQVTHQQLIIDADGLYWLSQLPHSIDKLQHAPILTPHLGEWQRLTEIKPPADSMKQNLNYQKSLQAYIVLKKQRTEIYSFGKVWVNTCGNPAMATGGMGDILAGIISSLVSQMDSIEEALVCGVFLHSYTADLLARSHYITLPTRIIRDLPQVMKQLILEKEGEK